jgi:ribosomal protein L7/L12
MESEFNQLLKNGSVPKILRFKIDNKVNRIVENICSLKIETISQLLPLLNIKIDSGNKIPLFIKATECSPEIFGFVKAYFGPSGRLLFGAYFEALKNNKVDILKKIRGLTPSNLKKMRDYVKQSKSVSLETVNFVTMDYKLAKSKKSVSEPSLFIKRKMKHNVRKSMNNI